MRIGLPVLSGAGLLSMLLRAALLGGKFAFVMALARHTAASTVGLYSLIVAIVTIFLYAIGAELHTHAIREVVTTKALRERATHFQNHLLYVLIFFALSLPLAWSVLSWLEIESKISFGWFCLVLLGEVLSQELGRYLAAMSLPVASNFLQLLRGGAWIPVAIWIFWVGWGPPILVTMVCWFGGCVCAIAFGLFRLWPFVSSQLVLSRDWINVALRSSKYYFVLVLLAQIQSYADRLIIQKSLGAHYVGQLTFYQSFANTIQGFVLTGVVSVALPQLLVTVRAGAFDEANRICNRMTIGGISIAGSISLAILLGIGTVLKMLGKQEYDENLHLLPWMLLGNVFLILGQVQHYRLFAMKKDKPLMLIALVTAPVAILANVGAVEVFGLNGIVAAFVIMSFIQATIKWRVAKSAWGGLVS